MTPEEVKKNFLSLEPNWEDLRFMQVRIPFTAEEWEKIKTYFNPGDTTDEKWLMFTQKRSLYIYRSIEAPEFFWRADFEEWNGGWVLKEIFTLKSNYQGEVFGTDDKQRAFVWYLIELKIFDKAEKLKLTHEDFYWPASQFITLPYEAPFEKFMEMKKKLVEWLAGREHQRQFLAAQPERTQWREDLNKLLLFQLQGASFKAPFLFRHTAEKLLEETKRLNGFLHETAIDQGLIGKEEMLRFLSEEWDVPIAVLSSGSYATLSRSGCEVLGEDFCLRYSVLAMGPVKPGSSFPVAMASPLNQALLDEITVRTDCKPVPHLAMPAEITKCMSLLFREQK